MAYITFQPHDYFNTLLYTGDGQASRSVTGVGFQPDWVWFKNRNTGDHHKLFDAVRGANKVLYGNLTAAEATVTQELQSFNSDGFTVGTESAMNGNGNGIAAWNWRAAGTSGSSNSDGSITSTVSVNTTAGFSIVTYTGTGSAGATVGHGLGAKPAFILEKGRSVTDDWLVYHHKLGADVGLALNNNTAETDSDSYWNDVEPTSTVFTIGSNGKVNTSGGTHVAYVFTEKKGFSKFGSYLGNGSASNGPFIVTGFKPGFLLIKRSIGGTDSWFLNDTARASFGNVSSNPSRVYLRPNETSSEGTSTSHEIMILSNGFKVLSSDTAYNTDGHTYTYYAFAEEPLVASNEDPATAR